ncbi:MAG: hypothetical protein M3253_03450, partial [Chloroflexota bacterium]|nr:hypothetical protein [Chloroflexota bacterium]
MAESFESFCERCGTRHVQEAESANAALGGRLLRGLRRTDSTRSGLDGGAGDRAQEGGLLRLCLACRGYNCAACWNESAGYCQECVPLAGIAEGPVAVGTDEALALPAVARA